MKILYIKTLSAVIFLLIVLLPGIYLWFGYLYKTSDRDINHFLSEGSLNYIETVLIKTPQNKWQTILNNLSPKNSVATIIPLETMSLDKKQRAQLLQGKPIYINGANYLFLYYGTERTYVYKRIGNTMYGIKLPLGESAHTLVHSSIEWMTSIIDLELSHHHQKNWPFVLSQLEKKFSIGLKIETENVSPDIKNQLKTHRIAFAHHTGMDHISTIYVSLKNSNAVLKMGPFDNMPATKQFSVFQHYYFWIFSIIAILIVFFLTHVFSRNVKKIDDLTTYFSHGKFSHHTSLSRFSVLKGIHTNVISMGNKINTLIKSQQNMTRFVAHEIRTPLSTIQLALDAVKKDHDFSHVESIQEDIDILNKLITTFLLYSQTTSHELKLKKEMVNIDKWIKKIIQPYQKSNITISFLCHGNGNISLDPKFLKHVIDNLITNALKFAKKEIKIIVHITDTRLIIIIEDDGPGIPKNEMENIFFPFTTLSDNHYFGKHIGLGLTIAKTIVELHGGTIQVSESSMGGARFSVLIPLR